jgi:cation:H+ antiporter
MFSYILFIIGFVFLIKGANFLVDSASSLARRLKVTDLVIGLTVVAFGTSCPELFVNIMASIKGTTDIAIGNIIGSNICNIFLILGVSSIIFPLSISKGTVWKEIPLSLLAVLLLGILANDHFIDRSNFSALSRIDGMVFLSFFTVFMYYSFSIAREPEGLEEQIPTRQYGIIKSLIMIILGLAGLALGGKWIVEGATQMALKFGMSQSLIGLTIVAVGTSLPELATSVTAALKKNPEIAVGNVVGSNIFNIFFILGISSIIKPLPVQRQVNIDVGVTIFASLLLFLFAFTGRKRMIDKWEGIAFITLYTGYIASLIIRG